MYQSVFVIGEERRECAIATEVSPEKNNNDHIKKYLTLLEKHPVVPSAPSFTHGDSGRSYFLLTPSIWAFTYGAP